MNRVFIDAETSPNIGLFWKAGWKINIDADNIIKERAIICICWKWQHEKTVKFLKWDAKQNDKKMIQAIVKVLNQADEIVAQNGDAFDLPWVRTRAAYHGIATNPHWKTIDTLLFARKKMLFNSNKLDYLGKFLGCGGKIKTEFGLWKDVVLKNDKKALARMVEYCKRDVLLLEKVYLKLSEHMAVQTHAGVYLDQAKWTCGHCASSKVKVNMTRVSARGVVTRQMQCKKCGRYYAVSDKAYRDYLKVKEDEKKHKAKMAKLNKFHKD